jgi:hypothetical protein
MNSELTVRDVMASQALIGLMHHWETLDENGNVRNKKGDSESLAQQAMCGGWGSNHPDSWGEENRKHTFAEAIASDAYCIADAMMTERERKEKQLELKSKPEKQTEHNVPFIGGPWHGVPQLMTNLQPFIELEDGQYHRHYLGIEGKYFHVVYIWSELHAEEAVDLLFRDMALTKK